MIETNYSDNKNGYKQKEDKMKLKYYMRGIGIGIIFSTIILSISHKTSTTTMTDAEVIRRAEQLGMVKEDSQLINELDDLLHTNDKKNDTNPITPTTSPEPSVSIKPENNIEDEDEIADTFSDTNNDTLGDNEQEKEDTIDVESGSDNAIKEEEPFLVGEVTTDDKEEVTFLQIEISKGMTSEDVSRILEEKGIIEDKKVFNKYLKENGLSRVINYGTFKIAQDATFYDIANLLVSK